MLFLMEGMLLPIAAGVEKNNLESVCEIADTGEDFKKAISELFQKSFTQDEIDKRKKILERML